MGASENGGGRQTQGAWNVASLRHPPIEHPVGPRIVAGNAWKDPGFFEI